MRINEIFYSVQGEGKWTGLPNIFIRTTGCNLRCSFCDTTYAYENGTEMKVGKIVNYIKKYRCKHICITGGEPLLQSETNDLIDALLEKDYKICLETNGSMDIKKLVNKNFLMISLDIKCPSSNMHKKMNFANILYLRKSDQLKFIIKDKNDYDYAKKTIEKYKPRCSVYFQPVWGSDSKKLLFWILNDGLDIRLGLQIHKMLFGNKEGI